MIEELEEARYQFKYEITQRCREQFGILDVNGDGFVSRDELKNAL